VGTVTVGTVSCVWSVLGQPGPEHLVGRLLQVGVAGDPRWLGFGPDNRVEGRPVP
jgi:hypothetical protein